MNTFVTIMCFALVATAVAQPAYNYQQPKQSFRPAQPSGNSGIYSVQQSPPLASFNVQSQQQQQFQQNFVSNAQPIEGFAAPNIGLSAPPQYAPPVQASSQYLPPVQQQNGFSGPATGAQYQPTSYQPQQQTIVSKDIFIHAAPEETEEIGNDLGGAEAGPLRKNYRIVFIKAPSQNLKLNLDALKRAQASNEEKTVIYVLSKKPDLANLQNQLAAVQPEQKAHKPEVFFIKYKTQEEANRAQQEIQAQYDSLGGSTSISDEGVAPVTSVIGGGPVNIGSVGSSFNGGNVGSVGSSLNGGNVGSVGSTFNGGNVGSVGSSFNGGNVGSVGSSFNGGNVGPVGSSFSGGNVGPVGSSFNGGSNFAGGIQQQQFTQQNYQSNHGSSSSSVSFGSTPSQKYLPAQKK